ncbi:MAG: ABC transporter ATP-binding protein [Proteobacteria bacterium]|nr:ABC transporter ATP-binding protein [Pseudomonadota bacterium]
MPATLEAKSLVKHFGDFVAVENISFKLKQGEVLGFLGPNGAGKTTTMKMLTGFLAPTSGTAWVNGFDIGEAPIEAKQRIGYLPEGAPIYGDMTPLGFLRFVAEVRRFEGPERDAAVAKAVATLHLEGVLEQTIETLSKGFQRRVGLAQAILHDPEILILDEPTDGLDPNQKHEVRDLIRKISANKVIVISTHILEEVEAVCTRAMIIDRGKVVADETPQQLKRRSAYHNAVKLSLESVDPQSVIRALEAASGVQRVEAHDTAGRLEITAFPMQGRSILDEVRGVVQAAGLQILELSVESGRLKDVFRELTHSDTGAGSEGSDR